MDATYFHGADGLGNVHSLAPKFTAPKEWMDLFGDTVVVGDGRDAKNTKDAAEKHSPELIKSHLPFIPSRTPSYIHILDILRNEEPDTVVIVAIGPLMNLAKAAELDPETFSRVKHVVCMGGALDTPGNVTPYAEFNIFSDALAASKVFELTSIQSEAAATILGRTTGKKLEFTLFPLDITNQHQLLLSSYTDLLNEKGYLALDDSEDGDSSRLADGVPPLVEWTHIWLTTTFNTFKRITGYNLKTREQQKLQVVGLNMHDPLALFYGITCLGSEDVDVGWIINRDVDLRVEHKGDLTLGMTLHDSRKKPKRDGPVDITDDRGVWLSTVYGNRVNVAVSSPYKGSSFGITMLDILYSN